MRARRFGIALVLFVSGFFLAFAGARPAAAQSSGGPLCTLQASWTDSTGAEQTHSGHVNNMNGSTGFSVLENVLVTYQLSFATASEHLLTAASRGDIIYEIRERCDADWFVNQVSGCNLVDTGSIDTTGPVRFYGNPQGDDNDSNHYEYVVNVFYRRSGVPDDNLCRFRLNTSDAGDVVTDEREEGPRLSQFAFCDQVPDGEAHAACLECLSRGGYNADDPAVIPENGRLYTAVGCIRTSQEGFTADVVRLLLGVAGGVALLSTIAASFYYTTSQGDSTKVKKAKEYITSSVAGLFFIIFAVIILDFIGVRVLRIPGLG